MSNCGCVFPSDVSLKRIFRHLEFVAQLEFELQPCVSVRFTGVCEPDCIACQGVHLIWFWWTTPSPSSWKASCGCSSNRSRQVLSSARWDVGSRIVVQSASYSAQIITTTVHFVSTSQIVLCSTWHATFLGSKCQACACFLSVHVDSRSHYLLVFSKESMNTDRRMLRLIKYDCSHLPSRIVPDGGVWNAISARSLAHSYLLESVKHQFQCILHI